jgi:hypothetical protein
VAQASDLDLFAKMSALEFSFELLVANELACGPEKPLAQSRPKKRNRALTLPSSAKSKPPIRSRRKTACREAQVG